MQKNYTEDLRKLMLHVRIDRINWEQLAHWTYVAEGLCGCKFEVRCPNTSPSMLQLQYKSWGKRCRLLQAYARRNRKGKDVDTRKRPPKNSKGL